MPASRRMSTFLVVLLAVTAVPVLGQDADRSATDGGIHVDEWMGRVDARAAADGMSVMDTRMALEGDGIKVTTGPAATYWYPARRLTGEYTVTATFTEPAYMALNNHPHPYGLVVAGSDMGGESERFLYCATYGNGRFIVRGFGPEPFQVNGRRPESHEAINVAAGEGEPVTQEIAVRVRSDRVECAVNGTVVGSYPRSEVVADGRLGSTDGVYGLRFGHNTEAIVTDLRVTRP